MFIINKIRADHVIDFAAEELKKYLRMMMPEVGEIQIHYTPDAREGFRLGLLEDFGIAAEAHDPHYDDIVHIETQEDGGILAGSNTRSVLFAVYRLLKLNGCRFLFPGIDGEHIPRKKITPQSYHKMADHPMRGHSLEGDPSLQQVLDYIDWHAKEELNCFGCYSIFNYMGRYYKHRLNTDNRPVEYMDIEVAENQWRSLFECETLKRGLLLNSGGHGLIMRSLGLRDEDRFPYKRGEKEIPTEVLPYVAMLDGERKPVRNDFFFTNLCMSNPTVRKNMIDTMIKDILAKPQVDNASLSLADGTHNHCECEACKTKRPSDWMVITLNELDEELTRRNIDKKISFSFYVDRMFPPAYEKIKNPERFRMTYCPITRTYNASMSGFENLPEPIPYEYNAWKTPKSLEEIYALLNAWRTAFTGSFTVFEYHFWLHQYRDPGLMSMSRRLYEDVLTYKNTNMDGCMQDGSNKSFFPHGFHGHIYAVALLDRNCEYDAELSDYFSHLYGEDWQLVREYLEKITECFSHKYMAGELSADPAKGKLYNPQRLTPLSQVKAITEEMETVVAEHMLMPTRPQTVAWRILLRHTEYCRGLAAVMMEKCRGHDELAMDMLLEFFKSFGRHDYELERYLDFGLCANSIKRLFEKSLTGIEL